MTERPGPPAATPSGATPSAATPSGATPARSVANEVIRRTFEEGAYTDRALLAAASGLEPRDRALATRLAYGVVQRRATLDHVLGALSDRPAERIDAPALAALRLGLVQILFLDGIADHAAVSESVELAKAGAPRAAGFVNAILRRAVREGPGILAAMGDDTPAGAALRHSHPAWIAELWWAQLGAAGAVALMAADNEPAEVALRANTLVATPEDVAAELGGATVAEQPPESLVLDRAFDAHAHPLHAQGAFMPQSRASAMVARIVAPHPGERILDLCAAPGGKTTHLAALMRDEGTIVAVERNPARSRALAATAARMHATCVEVVTADARSVRGESFDRVLVDPPCSGLGTLRSRPDLRWRITPDDVDALAVEQCAILEAGARATRPGGVLVYSTCTISPHENELLIDRFLAGNAGWRADDLQADLPLWHHPGVPDHLQSLPHRDRTDGFFIARLRREG